MIRQSKTVGIRERDNTFGRKLVIKLCKQFLEEGIVEPNGKTDEQALKELFDFVRKWSKRRPMMMSTDYKADLLRQARTFAKQNDERPGEF